MAATLYNNLRSLSGEAAAILCENGHITATGAGPHGAADVLDGKGYLVLPAFVEPHVHLDKTLWGEPWQPGKTASKLSDYIENERRVLSGCKTPIATRAGRLLERMIGFGTTTVRSHIDVAPDMGLSLSLIHI